MTEHTNCFVTPIFWTFTDGNLFCKCNRCPSSRSCHFSTVVAFRGTPVVQGCTGACLCITATHFQKKKGESEKGCQWQCRSQGESKLSCIVFILFKSHFIFSAPCTHARCYAPLINIRYLLPLFIFPRFHTTPYSAPRHACVHGLTPSVDLGNSYWMQTGCRQVQWIH